MKNYFLITLMTLFLCVCTIFGLTACTSQADIDNAVNEAIAPLNSQITELEADIAHKTAKITTLETEKAALISEKEELEAEIAVLEASNEALEDEKTALNERIDELEASILAKDTEISSLNSSISTFQREKAELEAQILELRNKNEKLESEKSKLENKVVGLKKCLKGEHEYENGACKYCEYVCPHEPESIDTSYVWSDDRFICTAKLLCNNCSYIVESEKTLPVLDKVSSDDGYYYVRATFENQVFEEQALKSYWIRPDGVYIVYDSHGLYVWNVAAQLDSGIGLQVGAPITLPTGNITVTNGIPSGSNWTPVGTLDNPFTGTISCDNSYPIIGLRLNEDNFEALGFLGYNAGNINSVVLEDVYVYGENSVANYVGAFAGVNMVNGTIGDAGCCVYSGTISARNGAVNYAGGAVGYNYGDIHSTGAYADVVSDGIAGGVIGGSSSESDVILGCYHVGTVSGKERAGGVCGYAEQSVIVGCYHKGTVKGEGVTGAIVGGKTFSSSMVNYWEDDTAMTANGVDNENATEVADGDWLSILSQFNAEIDNTSYKLLEYSESERFEAMPFNSRVLVAVSGGNKK